MCDKVEHKSLGVAWPEPGLWTLGTGKLSGAPALSGSDLITWWSRHRANGIFDAAAGRAGDDGACRGSVWPGELNLKLTASQSVVVAYQTALLCRPGPVLQNREQMWKHCFTWELIPSFSPGSETHRDRRPNEMILPWCCLICVSSVFLALCVCVYLM